MPADVIAAYDRAHESGMCSRVRVRRVLLRGVSPALRAGRGGGHVMPAEHTHGPWSQPVRYDPESGMKLPCGAVDGPDGRIVASLEGRTVDEWAANARLIAAAPEMLEALERIVEATWDGDVTLAAPRMADAVRARAAIAKARGAEDKN